MGERGASSAVPFKLDSFASSGGFAIGDFSYIFRNDGIGTNRLSIPVGFSRSRYS